MDQRKRNGLNALDKGSLKIQFSDSENVGEYNNLVIFK